MKVLFLHLSDAHLRDNEFIPINVIDAQVQALNAVGGFDKCCIVFSGDLAHSAQVNEYKKCQFYLGRLWKKITDKFSLKYPVNTLVVPGNHDIDFNGKPRNRSEVSMLLSSGVTDNMIAEELKRFENFYTFAERYNCFQYNKLIDIKHYELDGKKLQINLINSELFSTCNDNLGDDDKGKHFLPESEWSRLARGQNVDIVVTVSHRGPEWFN